MNLRRAASDPAVRSIANVQTTILVADIHDSQAKDNGITYIRKLSPLRCAIVQIFSSPTVDLALVHPFLA
jgi:hypothetical protein